MRYDKKARLLARILIKRTLNLERIKRDCAHNESGGKQ